VMGISGGPGVALSNHGELGYLVRSGADLGVIAHLPSLVHIPDGWIVQSFRDPPFGPGDAIYIGEERRTIPWQKSE
jgi:hypothetical protein